MTEVFPAFLRAEFDPSGNGFPAFERAAEQASSSVRQRFEADFATIKQTVANALSIPRNAGGSLDLGVDQQRAAAKALEAQATAAREVAAAMRQAAAAAGDNSSQARASLAAAEALEVEYRQEAQAALAHAEALEQVQVQLNRTKSATDAVILSAGRGTNALGAVTNSTRAWRFASLQAGQQLQDVVIQAQAGVNGFIILAQQGSQLAFAFSGLEGEAGSLAARVGGLARFLAGPWGAAILVATAVLGPFVAKMISGGDASDNLRDKTLSLEEALDRQRIATDDARKALADYNDAQRQAADRDSIAAENSLRLADARLQEAIATRKSIQAHLSAVQGDVNPNDPLDQQRAGAQSYYASKLADEANQISTLEQTRRNLRITVAEEAAKAATDPIEAINHRYDQMADAAKRAARGNDALSQSLAGTLTKIEKQRNAALEAARASERSSSRSASSATSDTGTTAASRFADAQQRALEVVQRIDERFDDQPRLIDRAAQAQRTLNKIITDYSGKQDATSKQILANARDALSLVGSAAGRFIAEQLADSVKQHQVQQLIIAGDQEGADVLAEKLRLMDQLGATTDEQLNQQLRAAGIDTDINELLRARVALRQADADAMELMRQRQQVFLNALGQTQQVIARSIANLRTGGLGGGLKSLFNGLGSTMDQLLGNFVAAQLGPAFQSIARHVRGETPLDRANVDLAATVIDATTSIGKVPQASDRLSHAVNGLADTIERASNRIGGVTGAVTRSAANDNRVWNPLAAGNGLTADQRVNVDGSPIGSDIVVVAHRLEDMLRNPFLFSGDVVAKTVQSLANSVGIHISDDSIKAMGQTFSGAIEGLYAGQVAGGLILGSHGDRTGEALGGALGGALGKSLEAGATKLLGKTLGSLAGPIGGALGGVLGGLVGGLFHSSKQGGAVLTGSGSGAIFGNSTAYKQQASSLSQSVQSGLQNIVDQLGGTLGSYLVSIGTYNGSYRVNPSGGTKLGGGHGKLGNVIFGDDEQAAVQYAILDAIKDGAVRGIDQGAQRLLAAGNDLTVQLQKALSFEQVFKDLKAHTDPVGAAIDEVDAKFTKLKAIFAEAGASAQQYADLQKEYDYERSEAIKQATQQSLGSLKDLLSQLTTGDNGRSLRDRIAAARAAYDPLAAQIKAGDTSNADQFSSAAQTLLGLTQQLNGSQTGTFTLLDQVTALTQNAVTAQQKLIDNATNGSTPFADAQGTSAVTGSINDMNSSLSAQLAAVNKNLGTTIAQNDNIIQALSQRGALGRSNF